MHGITGLQASAGNQMVRSVIEGVCRLYSKPVVKNEIDPVKSLRDNIVAKSDLTPPPPPDWTGTGTGITNTCAL